MDTDHHARLFRDRRHLPDEAREVSQTSGSRYSRPWESGAWNARPCQWALPAPLPGRTLARGTAARRSRYRCPCEHRWYGGSPPGERRRPACSLSFVPGVPSLQPAHRQRGRSVARSGPDRQGPGRPVLLVYRNVLLSRLETRPFHLVDPGCPFLLVGPGTLGPAAALGRGPLIRRTPSVDHLGSARSQRGLGSSTLRRRTDRRRQRGRNSPQTGAYAASRR
jgi:hypothetical protein